MIKAVGYMIQDKQGNAIFGVGETVEEAWQQVVNGAGNFIDAYGDHISSDEAFLTQFRVYGATAALIDEVQTQGGDISWQIIRGVACIKEENYA
jgi:hypothetical protein